MAILSVAAVAISIITLLRRDGEVPTAPASTTSVEIDESALRTYADRISGIAVDVVSSMETAREINEDWDNRDVDYDTTVGRMAALVNRVSVLPDRLGAITPPEEAEAALHERMIETLITLASYAERMRGGLESSDAGESRRIASARFETSAVEFGLLAAQLTKSVDRAAAAASE